MMANLQNKQFSVLSHNIKFLRKQLGLSQDDFAKKIGIKRSSIAAYESKNVEPRLSVILEIAHLCNINIQDLIEYKLDDSYDPKDHLPNDQHDEAEGSHYKIIESDIEIDDFIDKSMKIRKVLDGFKAFYDFKKVKMLDSFPNKENLFYDIENFFSLMEDLLSYNESLISTFRKTDI